LLPKSSKIATERLNLLTVFIFILTKLILKQVSTKMDQIPTSMVAHLVKTPTPVEDWKRDTFDTMNKNVAAHNVLATEILTKKKLEAVEIKIQAEALEKVTSEVKKVLPSYIKNFYGSIDIKQRELLWINRYQALTHFLIL
jgi:hypothetical protein